MVIYVMTSGGMGVSFDSERYLATAYHLKQGDYEEAFHRIYPHAPMLYPLAITSLPWMGTDRGVSAARLISIFAFVVSVSFVFLLGLKLQGEMTAHLVAVSLLLFAPFVYTFCYCWSETLYIALSLLFLLASSRYYLRPGDGDLPCLVACAVFAGLGFITRFIGVSLIAAGVIIILLRPEPAPGSKRVKRLSAFVLAAAVPMVINMLVAFAHLGTLARKTAPSPFSMFHQLLRFFSVIYRDFLSSDLAFQRYAFLLTDTFGGSWLDSPLFWLEAVAVVCLLLLVIFLLILLFSSRAFRQALAPQLVPLAYVVPYALLLIAVSSTTYLDPLGSRFTSPLYPVIVLTVISTFAHMWTAMQGKGPQRLMLFAAVAVTLSFWGIQTISLASIHRGICSGSLPAMENPGNLNRASLRFLQESATVNDLIVTNVRMKMFFIWPRKAPYLANPGSELRPHLGLLMREAQRCSASTYVLICTEDFSQNAIDDIEEINRDTGFFPQKRVFGNDVVYKADFGSEDLGSRNPP